MPREGIVIMGCRHCDADKSPIDIPGESCGHPYEWRKTHWVHMIPMEALDRAAGTHGLVNLLLAVSNGVRAEGERRDSNTDIRNADALVRVTQAIEAWSTDD